MKKYYLITVVILTLFNNLEAKLNIVTTTTDLASITANLTGEKAQISSLSSGKDDIHFLEARPDFILKASKADLFIQIGADLEIGWVPMILQKSRNFQIMPNGNGHCNTQNAVHLKEKPSGTISRADGDVHAQGNPHYWIDPLNGILIAQYISQCLAKVDPANAEKYRQNFQNFSNNMKNKLVAWQKRMQKHAGKSVIVYHSEFVYLLDRFKLKQQATVENISGVAPSMAQVDKIVKLIKEQKITAILISPWSNSGVAGKVARQSNAKLIILPIQSSSTSAAAYFEMLEKSISLLETNL